MKKRWNLPVVWMMAVFAFALSVFSCSFAIGEGNIGFRAEICVYAISNESKLRDAGDTADISLLGEDEYYSFCLTLQNNTDKTLRWDKAGVSVNGGQPWTWSAGSLSPGKGAVFHIYYANMKAFQTAGTYTVDWYFDGEKVCSARFTLTEEAPDTHGFPIPSDAEIEDYNRTNTTRSPYIYGWYRLSPDTRYTEYSVDFRADHLPIGTYCCLGSWKMDYSALKSQYAKVSTEYESVQGYAGFQRTADGGTVSILSVWDIFCQDQEGHVTTIRPERLYPDATVGSDRFSGEGTGEHTLVSYPWEAQHWYRMRLRCSVSPTTGNTVVEQWVTNLETNDEALLCAYDLGVPRAAFTGSIAVFLENFLPEYGGDLRSLQVRNAQYLEESSGTWKSFDSIYLAPNGGAPAYLGSYDFGVSDHTVWMITSGVGGDWYGNGRGKQGKQYTLK